MSEMDVKLEASNFFEEESLHLMWGTSVNPHQGVHYQSNQPQHLLAQQGAPGVHTNPYGNFIVTPINPSGSAGLYRGSHQFQTPEKVFPNLKKRDYFSEDVKLEPSPQTVDKYHYKALQEHHVMNTEREDHARDSNDSSDNSGGHTNSSENNINQNGNSKIALGIGNNNKIPANQANSMQIRIGRENLQYETIKREHNSDHERLVMMTPRSHGHHPHSASSHKIGSDMGAAKRLRLKDMPKQLATFHSQKKLKTEFPTPNQKKRSFKDFDLYPTPKSHYSFYSTENSDRENEDTPNRKSRGIIAFLFH